MSREPYKDPAVGWGLIPVQRGRIGEFSKGVAMDWPLIMVLIILAFPAILLAGLIWEYRKSSRRIEEIEERENQWPP